MAGTLQRFLSDQPNSEQILMSTAAISSSSIYQQTEQYFQTRQSDVQQLGQALQSGDLAGAQTAYNNIVQLGQIGPFASLSVGSQGSKAQEITFNLAPNSNEQIVLNLLNESSSTPTGGSSSSSFANGDLSVTA
jgi:hypothetical protein